MNRPPMKETLQNSIQRAWEESLAKVTVLQNDISRRLRAMRQRADWQQNRAELQRVMSDFKRRLHSQGDALEKRLEESVRCAVARVQDPLQQQLASLRMKAERLGTRIESQPRRRASDTDGEPGATGQ